MSFLSKCCMSFCLYCCDLLQFSFLILTGILQSASCVTFEVKDSANKTCIMADLSVNFSVEYKAGMKQVCLKW